MVTRADTFSRLAALRPVRPLPQKPATLRAPDETDPLGRLLGAGVARNHYGEHLAIRNWFSTPEFVSPSPISLELLWRAPQPSVRLRVKAGRCKERARESPARQACAAVENPENWLFLDTETTGLSGGTGTYAFLIGMAWWDAGGLQVEQLFLRDFSEEHSVLYELSARLAERPVLVTFNGKSFDWPLLENRFTLTRSIATPRLAAHLDLLHPARALWRLRLGSVRLVELERQVLDPSRLGWRREDDVVSAEIPGYYFDYLRGGAPDPLAAVVKHNQMDLRGLAALFGRINNMLDARGTDVEGVESLDLFGLARFLQRRGETKRAHSACSMALDAGLPQEFRPQATRDLAVMAKRRGELERAASLWEQLIVDSRDGMAACEQLAIYYERRMRDFARALEFAQLGLAKAERTWKLARDPSLAARSARFEQRLVQRVQRLQARMAAKRQSLLCESATAVNVTKAADV